MVVWALLALPVAMIVVSGIVYRRSSGRCTSQRRMDGFTVLITGASAGIGAATAHDLAKRGARVIMGCRNVTKGQRVADMIKEKTGSKQVLVEEVDLSDLNSVRKFADKIKKTEKSLHVLINNAGAGIKEKKLTPDNLEMTMATNYYGHFLLTNLLLGLLKSSSPSRIINVSSELHKITYNLDVQNLNYSDEKRYSTLSAYAQSKLCNILFSKELAYKLQETGVTVNSLHPGLVATESFHKVGTWRGYIYSALVRVIGKDCATGAQTTIYLSVSDEVEGVSGKYYIDCKEAKCHEQADNDGLAKKLWEASEKDVQLQPNEIYY